MSTPRLILFHKQSTSARTRFLRHGHGGICTLGPLPTGPDWRNPPPAP